MRCGQGRVGGEESERRWLRLRARYVSRVQLLVLVKLTAKMPAHIVRYRPLLTVPTGRKQVRIGPSIASQICMKNHMPSTPSTSGELGPSHGSPMLHFFFESCKTKSSNVNAAITRQPSQGEDRRWQACEARLSTTQSELERCDLHHGVTLMHSTTTRLSTARGR